MPRTGASIFAKMIVLLILLLIPVMLLYMYFNKLSETNIKTEIQHFADSRLSYSMETIDSQFDSMMLLSGLISQDTSLRQLEALNFGTDLFDRRSTEIEISEKIQMLSTSGKWKNDITLFIPKNKQVISTESSASYQEEYIQFDLTRQWSYQSADASDAQQASFVYHLVGPLSASLEPEKANYIIEVRVYKNNLIDMLNQFKAGNPQTNPFLYNPVTSEVILNSSVAPEEVETVISQYRSQLSKDLKTVKREEIEISNEHYQVNAIKSSKIGWYLVDYVPLSAAFSTLSATRDVFYLSVAMLLMMAVIASYMFYRHVQSPVMNLVSGVQRLKLGDYSVRIPLKGPFEFRFLFARFNQMAEEIQTLIEDVYQEKLRSKEATLKQLQAQINPHFLYNCLFFIKNMSSIGNDEAVEQMTINLGEFFRYVTRSESRLASIKDEIEFVRHYLNIQHLRMPRLHVVWEVSDDLLDEEIPRLLIQPIVENAIVHGIESIRGEGIVRIIGIKQGAKCQLIFEDNGIGMTAVERQELERCVAMPLTEEMGCGVWNVCQRLVGEFGAGSKVTFFESELGGLGVKLEWNGRVLKGEEKHVSDTVS